MFYVTTIGYARHPSNAVLTLGIGSRCTEASSAVWGAGCILMVTVTTIHGKQMYVIKTYNHVSMVGVT